MLAVALALLAWDRDRPGGGLLRLCVEWRSAERALTLVLGLAAVQVRLGHVCARARGPLVLLRTLLVLEPVRPYTYEA